MTNEKTIIVASKNKGKIKEFAEMLKGYRVIGCEELGFMGEIEETGSTFYENALIKAETVSKALNLPALADDSGLCVDALGGAPSIYSARYAGDGNDEHNNDKLLENLKGVKNRKAHYTAVLVMCYPDGRTVSSEGNTYGEILEERCGTNGFGYDSLFYSDDLKKSFGLATAEEKNSVSHRARALKALREKLD